jgi:flagellar hook-basal body complex protein FliE
MEAIRMLGAVGNTAAVGASTAGSAAAAPGASFGDALRQALEGVNQAQNDATELGKRFQLGDANVSLEETMISMQKASISLQAVVQARNRIASAYHDIMNMQV